VLVVPVSDAFVEVAVEPDAGVADPAPSDDPPPAFEPASSLDPLSADDLAVPGVAVARVGGT